MGKLWMILTLSVSLFGSVPLGQKPAPASQVLNDAEAQAAKQHKLIFLVFSASWCGPCHQLDSFVTAKEIDPILNKYFVFAKLNVEEKAGKHPELESPGGEDLAAKLGAVDARSRSIGLPFIVFLDATGKLMANSNRPVDGQSRGASIGYPATPEEIDWFMAMLKKAVPSMSAAESHTIEDWLRNVPAT